jgi:beta-lactamase regulating signal transducer with metallopeptidase domain
LIKFFTPPIVTAPLPFAASCKSLPAYACIAGGYTTQIASNEHVAPTAPISSDAGFVEHPTTSIEQSLTPNDLSITGTRTVWSLSLALAAIWCAGSACIAIGYAFRIGRFARWLREMDRPSDEIYAAVERMAAKLGLRRAPEVVMTSRAVPPLVWCAGSRPRLVLPAELFERLSETARTTILAHELTHIRRGDYLVRLLELAAKTVFWWHPVVWWACAQLHDLEEQCCDAGVLELVPNQVRTYASALVDTLEFLSGQTRVVVPLPTAI